MLTASPRARCRRSRRRSRRRPRPPPPHFRRGCDRGGARAGGRWGWRDRLGAAASALGAVRSLRSPRALCPAGAMGNCHTVGPNEALVVSGERAAREVGPARRRWGVLGCARCALPVVEEGARGGGGAAEPAGTG